MAEENKGPFYSFNPAYRCMELNSVCQECGNLRFERKRDIRSDNNYAVFWAEPACTYEVCPRLNEVKKGAKNNG